MRRPLLEDDWVFSEDELALCCMRRDNEGPTRLSDSGEVGVEGRVRATGD